MRLRLLRGIVALCDFIAYHAARAEVRALLQYMPVSEWPKRYSPDGQRLRHLQGRLHSYERNVTGRKSVERALISAWMRSPHSRPDGWSITRTRSADVWNPVVEDSRPWPDPAD